MFDNVFVPSDPNDLLQDINDETLI